VCSTVALAPQRYLHIVMAGDRKFLVGSSSQQVSLIADLAPANSAMGSAVSGVMGNSLSSAADERAGEERFQRLLSRLEAHGTNRGTATEGTRYSMPPTAEPPGIAPQHAIGASEGIGTSEPARPQESAANATGRPMQIGARRNRLFREGGAPNGASHG
jgi:hypothetical protein